MECRSLGRRAARRPFFLPGVAHDSVAVEQTRLALAEDFADAPSLLGQIRYADKPMDATQGADALIVVTEWKAYRSPHLAALKTALQSPLIIDGRNLYDPHQLTAAGFTYMGIGRNNLAMLEAARRKAGEADQEVAAALLAHANAGGQANKSQPAQSQNGDKQMRRIAT